ncbi:MBL fold metallo-hydrolase [Kitasatospora atroaurantiaca]|uniref:L-ascorbate metabolism protein UlaG (Beta-lactamase superfamily) n=1 Tax=Kitasatospora atroaurantiaca TaxID=285545 RepID=A0A561EX60_9ACTN|nr:MBL fold metallo-hydrolase [Kitasatospora atroaurantiaca]TWE20189.1 L-ascorbate metabolism protein UlaG (beta-lactamase superfamily) [Kitasatospora atroaurantiaca]
MSEAHQSTGSPKRLLALTALAAAAGTVAWSLRDLPAAFGRRPDGTDPRIRNSPQYRDGVFHNAPSALAQEPQNPPQVDRSTVRKMLFEREGRTPVRPVPVVRPEGGPQRPAAEGIEIVWYGHASALVEIEGSRVLIDPIWSDRCSPVAHVGPKRLHPAPVELEELPQVDVVLISHDHYDHLDMATVKRLVTTQSAPFAVPLGIGGHLSRWGVPEHRIIELDWDETCTLGELTLTLTSAHHFSGRSTTRNTTLWGSWVIAGPNRKIYYTGDSGYFEGYAAIGEKHGPFDAALVQIGAYNEAWADIHMTPEDAVRAHLDLRAELLVPVHWCTFNLALHPWAEPIERLLAEAKAQAVPLAVPRPGQRVDVDNPPELDGWWEDVA